MSGMEATLLAPTAMNRQKFYFELLPDNSIKITCGKGLYTKLDLGIVKYHFEVVSGKRNIKIIYILPIYEIRQQRMVIVYEK